MNILNMINGLTVIIADLPAGLSRASQEAARRETIIAIWSAVGLVIVISTFSIISSIIGKNKKTEVLKKSTPETRITEKMSLQELENYFENHLHEINIPQSFAQMTKRMIKLENQIKELEKEGDK